MKKIFLSFALLTVIMLSFSSTIHANPVTLYVQFNITDTCNGGGYSGFYCVEWVVTINGSPVGSPVYSCSVKNGLCNHYQFTLDGIVSDPVYGVTVVSIARYPSGDCHTSIGVGVGTKTWSQMEDSGCAVSVPFTF